MITPSTIQRNTSVTHVSVHVIAHMCENAPLDVCGNLGDFALLHCCFLYLRFFLIYTEHLLFSHHLLHMHPEDPLSLPVSWVGVASSPMQCCSSVQAGVGRHECPAEAGLGESYPKLWIKSTLPKRLQK